MLDCRSLEATYLQLPPTVRLVICNTMVRHELAGGEYNERRASCEHVVANLSTLSSRHPRATGSDAGRSRTLPKPDFRARFSRCRHVITENDRVKDAKGSITESPISYVSES